MSHWIMGTLSVLFGLAGLLMAGAARDFGILLFGLMLALFGVLFCWWMIKTAYDEAERVTSLDSAGVSRAGLRRRSLR